MIEGEEGWVKIGKMAFWVAFIFAMLATLSTGVTVMMHLKNYKRPDVQRSTIRILFMVPIYAIASLIALSHKDLAIYVDVLRDVYEAFVIYCFFRLLVDLMDGERALLRYMRRVPPLAHFWPMYYCMAPMQMGNPNVFLGIKRCILQFVVVKPIQAILIVVLRQCGAYHEGYIAWNSSYLWLVLIYNVSVLVAMYALIAFFFATRDALQPHAPMAMFLCVKSVVFFSFWQGVIVSLAVFLGWIHDNDVYSADNIATAIQDFLICLEMFAASIAHAFAFGHQFYKELSSGRLPLKYALRDAFSLRDLVIDARETFFSASLPSQRVVSNAPVNETAPLLRSRNESVQYSSPFASQRLVNGPIRAVHDDLVDIHFADPETDPELETAYAASRRLQSGDYNFPVLETLRREIAHQRNPHVGPATRNRSHSNASSADEESSHSPV